MNLSTGPNFHTPFFVFDQLSCSFYTCCSFAGIRLAAYHSDGICKRWQYSVLYFLFSPHKNGANQSVHLFSFTEILIHAVLAVLSVGTGFGFQLYFIDCIAIMFLADYLSVHLGTDSIGSLKLGILKLIFCCLSFMNSL